MHSKSTSRIFDVLAIHRYEDALALQITVTQMAHHVWPSRTSARYSAVSLWDLPCQACEFNGVLAAVKSIHGGGDEKAIRFLLERLPGDVRQLSAMGQSLKTLLAKIPGTCDGYSRQAASLATMAWLNMNPKWQRESMHRLCTRGGGDIFGLPTVVCPVCSSSMSFHRERFRSDCDACYGARRRRLDAERSRKRRRLHREARGGNGRL